ncbi:hypothetical protein evm_007237 [Chilo suppressalis]|nr:hypothetical protein evm_007237 [Chilo suppressalis]
MLILSVILLPVMADLLEEERSSFFGFTHEIPISLSTIELVQQITAAIGEHAEGDRTVRRYFDKFETPFIEGDKK